MEEEVRANNATAILEVTAGLKPSSNQVAGHRFNEGRLGSLVDDDGNFYKPLQGDERGDSETSFYESFWGDSSVPENIKKFFPKFYGTVFVNATGKGPCKHAVMEDLTHGFKHPCIMDIKMGRRTWYEGAPEKYISKCLEKDASTTSGKLGFRVAGMQVYDSSSDSTWKADRVWCKKITESNMETVLERFVSLSPFEEKPKEGKTLSSEVYGGSGGVLEQLQELRDWFAVQTKYHFYSSSILVVYEGNSPSDGKPTKTSLRLVDFAHVIEGNGKVDQNFLEAIDSVVPYFTKLI